MEEKKVVELFRRLRDGQPVEVEKNFSCSTCLLGSSPRRWQIAQVIAQRDFPESDSNGILPAFLHVLRDICCT